MSQELANTSSELGIITATPFNIGDRQFYTSLDFSKADDAVNLFKMRQSSDKTAKELANVTFKVVHILRHWADGETDNGGEVRRYIRSVFLTESGDVVSCGSIGIERDIETLFALGVVPPWKPPIEMTPKLITSKTNRDMLQIQFNIPDILKRMKGEGKKSK